MNSTKLFCAIVLAVLLASQEILSQQIFCGSALRQVLEDLCVDGFNNKLPSTIKRSVPYGDTETEVDADILPLPFSALFVEYANAMAKTRRRRQGPYDECCVKACTYTELAQYCK